MWHFPTDRDLTRCFSFFVNCFSLLQKERLYFKNPSNILCRPDFPVNVRRKTFILAIAYSEFPQLARDVYRHRSPPIITIKLSNFFRIKNYNPVLRNPHPDPATKYYFHGKQNWEFYLKLDVRTLNPCYFKQGKVFFGGGVVVGSTCFLIHICGAIVLFLCVEDARLLHCT